MAKIVLGKRPKNFKRTVQFDLPEGGKGAVEATFVYRTRTEFGAFVDELLEGAGVAAKGQGDEDVKLSLKEALEKTVDTNAEYLMKSWKIGIWTSNSARTPYSRCATNTPALLWR